MEHIPKEILIKKNLLQPDKNGDTPIHLAAFTGRLKDLPLSSFDYEVFEYRDGEKKSVAEIAIERGHIRQLPQELPPLPPVSTVLGMTDENWHATRNSNIPVPGAKFSCSQKMGHYRTAHLIVYYHLHLDGEEGISKLSRFVSLKRKRFAEISAYRASSMREGWRNSSGCRASKLLKTAGFATHLPDRPEVGPCQFSGRR